IDPQQRAQATLALTSARDALIASDSEPTIEAVVARVRREWPQIPAEVLERVAVEALAADEGGVGELVRRRITRAVRVRLKITPEVRKSMREAFATVLEAFRRETLAKSPVLDEIVMKIPEPT